jgi:hypothetical protein
MTSRLKLAASSLLSSVSFRRRSWGTQSSHLAAKRLVLDLPFFRVHSDCCGAKEAVLTGGDTEGEERRDEGGDESGEESVDVEGMLTGRLGTHLTLAIG